MLNDELLLFPKLDHDKLEEHAIARELRRRQVEKINGTVIRRILAGYTIYSSKQ